MGAPLLWDEWLICMIGGERSASRIRTPKRALRYLSLKLPRFGSSPSPKQLLSSNFSYLLPSIYDTTQLLNAGVVDDNAPSPQKESPRGQRCIASTRKTKQARERCNVLCWMSEVSASRVRRLLWNWVGILSIFGRLKLKCDKVITASIPCLL